MLLEEIAPLFGVKIRRKAKKKGRRPRTTSKRRKPPTEELKLKLKRNQPHTARTRGDWFK